mgnify:FL=1
MKNILITILLTLFFVPLVSLAAPEISAYIVNDNSKEGAIYKGGDECVKHTMPEGWQFFGFIDETSCPAEYTEVFIETDSKPVWSLSCLMPFHSGSNYSALFFWPIIIAIVIIIVIVILVTKRKKSKNQKP